MGSMTVFVLIVVIAGGALLARFPPARAWPGGGPERAGLVTAGRGWAELGWASGLLGTALAAFPLFGTSHWLGLAVVLGAGVVAACWPRACKPVLAAAMLVLGLYGFVLAMQYAEHSQRSWQYGLVLAGAGSWRTELILLQVYAFTAAGLWLGWHSGRYSWLARYLPGGATRVAAMGVRPARWALLFVPVMVATAELVGMFWGQGRFLEGSVVAALVLAWAACTWVPAVAADLATAGVVAIGGYGIVLAATWQPVPSYEPIVMYGPLLVGNATAAGLAGLLGVALLGFGVWLAPRTVGTHLLVPRHDHPDPLLARRVERLTQTRAVAVDSAAAELRRIERDLHDGAQARLVALGMSLRAVEGLIESSPRAALALVGEAREASSRALADLRGLVRGIYPPVLADRGLADAIAALALDTPLRTEVDIDLAGRLAAPVESACYFAVAEALANAAKHAAASHVSVRIRHSRIRGEDHGGILRIEVTDDGVGGADPATGTGLAGVEKRLAAFDGVLAVSSPPGGPTMVIVEVPCALSSPKTSSSSGMA